MAFQGYRKDWAFTPALKIDARRAFEILDGTGISLEEAARRAVQGRRALKRIRFSEATDAFVRSRLQDGKRTRTVEWYMDKLSLAEHEFGERLFDEISRPEFFAWMKKLDCSEGTRAGIVRACRAVFRWGIAQEPQLVAVDITAGLKSTGPSNQGDAEFLTVDEVACALKNAGPYLSGMALLFFAGVRPEELAGRGKPPLLWGKHVRPEEKLIRIPAEIAKSGKPRLIENLPDTVWAFLEPKDDGVPVSPGRTRQVIESAAASIRELRKDPDWQWPEDATRHTFATYLFAVEMDAGKVAAWLGHEGKPQTFHRHYKGLARMAEGKRYLALRPTPRATAAA